MIDLRRVTGILYAAAFVLLGLVACESSLIGLKLWRPDWLGTDWLARRYEYFQGFGGELSSCLNEPLPRDRPLGMIFGSSSSFMIDPAILEKRLSPPLDWVALSAVMGGPTEMLDSLGLTLRSGLRPARVVMALEMPQLVRPDDFDYPPYSPFEDLRIGYHWQSFRDGVRRAKPDAFAQLRDLAEDLVSYGFNACFPDRIRSQQKLYYGLLRCRLTCLHASGQDLHAAFPPRPAVVSRPNANEHEDPNILRRKIEEMSQRGIFSPESYTTDRETYRSLIEFVRVGRAAGAEVTIVLTPILSELRRNTPPAARQSVYDLLRENFGANQSPCTTNRQAGSRPSDSVNGSDRGSMSAPRRDRSR